MRLVGAGVQYQCVEVRHNTEGINCIWLFLTQPSVLASLLWPMEGSATVQPPSPDFREPWLHTTVMRGILVEAPGPACPTECGVDHPSFVKVSCIDPLKCFLHTIVFSCELWQSSGDLKWNEPIFCNYIWRNCHLHVQWNICSIRKLHHYLYGQWTLEYTSNMLS